MATFPARKKEFEQTIKQLISLDIVDIIRVYLNEYTEIPDFAKHEKVHCEVNVPNRKDSGKFFWANTIKNEYYFTHDDDLVPSHEYFINHINCLKKYHNSVFVSNHGKVMKEQPTHFMDILRSATFSQDTKYDIMANNLGTGVMVFDNSKFSIPFELFEYDGMTDLWISYYCQVNNIPCVVREHKKNELTSFISSCSLWNKRHEMVNEHRIILNKCKWKIVPVSLNKSEYKLHVPEGHTAIIIKKRFGVYLKNSIQVVPTPLAELIIRKGIAIKKEDI